MQILFRNYAVYKKIDVEGRKGGYDGLPAAFAAWGFVTLCFLYLVRDSSARLLVRNTNNGGGKTCFYYVRENLARGRW